MKRMIVGASYGTWLFAILLVFYWSRGEDENALQLVVIAGALPAALQLLLLGLSTHGIDSPSRHAAALLLAIVLSYLAAGSDARLAPTTTDGPTVPLHWMPLVFATNAAFAFLIAVFVAGCPDRRLLRTIAATFAIVSAPFLLWVDLTGEYLWGRLAAQGIQPNFWGLMGLSVGVTAFAVRPRLLAAAVFAVGVVTIYQASARGSLAALLVASGVVGLLFVARELRSYRLALFLAAAGAALLGLLLVLPEVSALEDLLVRDVLKLDDPARGIGRGFTGREVAWSEAIALWSEHPIFGVGFRQHEQLLPSLLSAHNAYLSMLADTGVIGLALYLLLLGAALGATFWIRDSATRSMTMALLVAYAAIGFFERRAINSGNPLGLLFLMGCFYALAEAQIARVVADEEVAEEASEAGLAPAR